MTLSDFCDLVRNNLTFYERDYLERRKAAVNPNISHPLDRTPERWFDEMVGWFRIVEIIKRINTKETSEKPKELELKEFEK